jgi:hypothetical protein
MCREPSSSCRRTRERRRDRRAESRGAAAAGSPRTPAKEWPTAAEPSQTRRRLPRQGGSGPASGNGNSSRPAESAAAAHNFQAPPTSRMLALHTGPSLSHRAPERKGRHQGFSPEKSRKRISLVGAISQAGLAVSRKRATIVCMLLAIFAMRLLEVMFLSAWRGRLWSSSSASLRMEKSSSARR